MGFYDQLGTPPANGRQINPMQMLAQIRQNPAAALRQAGLNIPEGMTNPQQIINHLLQSGQVPQARYQQALQTMRRK